MFAGYMEEMGICLDDSDDVVLAVDEACINVIRHAFPHDEETFRLTADLSPDEAVVVVEDEGVGLPAEQATASAPPVDPWATSGRGLRIIRELMTSVDVETAPERRGTRVEMHKAFRAQR
jgi:anti-sigma regulatory factor (Ser/Thr protein kinase)